MKNQINIELNNDEALILFDFLSDNLSRIYESDVDKSVWEVLSRILAHLETELQEPFNNDYAILLDLARQRIKDKNEYESKA